MEGTDTATNSNYFNYHFDSIPAPFCGSMVQAIRSDVEASACSTQWLYLLSLALLQSLSGFVLSIAPEENSIQATQNTLQLM